MVVSRTADCIMSAKWAGGPWSITSSPQGWQREFWQAVLTLPPPEQASIRSEPVKAADSPGHNNTADGLGWGWGLGRWICTRLYKRAGPAMSISMKGVYFPDVLVFLVSPWHTASDTALHKCQPLWLCYLYLKSNILFLSDKTQRCLMHKDKTWAGPQISEGLLLWLQSCMYHQPVTVTQQLNMVSTSDIFVHQFVSQFTP